MAAVLHFIPSQAPPTRARTLRSGDDGGLNPNHHLWRNGHLWWIHFTVLHDGWRQERVRESLGTADIEEARRRRDIKLVEWPKTHGCELSIRVRPKRRHLDSKSSRFTSRAGSRRDNKNIRDARTRTARSANFHTNDSGDSGERANPIAARHRFASTNVCRQLTRRPAINEARRKTT